MKTLTKIGRYQTPTSEFRFNLSLVSYNIRELHDIRAEAQKEGMKAWCQVPRRQIHDPKDCTLYSNCPENDCFSCGLGIGCTTTQMSQENSLRKSTQGCIVHPVFSCGTSCHAHWICTGIESGREPSPRIVSATLAPEFDDLKARLTRRVIL